MSHCTDTEFTSTNANNNFGRLTGSSKEHQLTNLLVYQGSGLNSDFPDPGDRAP